MVGIVHRIIGRADKTDGAEHLRLPPVPLSSASVHALPHSQILKQPRAPT